MNTLKAEKRTLAVKAKKLRREGYVTGNVFGKEMKESIPVKWMLPQLTACLRRAIKEARSCWILTANPTMY